MSDDINNTIDGINRGEISVGPDEPIAFDVWKKNIHRDLQDACELFADSIKHPDRLGILSPVEQAQIREKSSLSFSRHIKDVLILEGRVNNGMNVNATIEVGNGQKMTAKEMRDKLLGSVTSGSDAKKIQKKLEPVIALDEAVDIELEPEREVEHVVKETEDHVIIDDSVFYDKNTGRVSNMSVRPKVEPD